MIFGKYQFFCSLENEAFLPPYKGSTFRGVFGRSLKKVVCTLKRQQCPECMLRGKCLYALTFETAEVLEPPENARIASIPHPFVIQPPLTTETHFPSGTAFDFNLLLFGEINHQLPYFVYAFDQMGRIGIGRKNNGKRGKFILKEVRGDGNLIYSASDQKLHAPDTFKKLSLSGLNSNPLNESRLTLTLKTPLRLKYNNRLKADLPFHVLVRAMLRRMSSLLNTYGGGEPDLDYRGLVKRAESVQISESNLEWFDWRRYSFRQDQAMLMGGMTGSVTYKGNIGEFMPLIDFCSKTHLGKQTAFGLGKIKTELFS